MYGTKRNKDTQTIQGDIQMRTRKEPKVTQVRPGASCKEQLPANRDGGTEPCGGAAVVVIDDVPYCKIHASSHAHDWEKQLRKMVSSPMVMPDPGPAPFS